MRPNSGRKSGINDNKFFENRFGTFFLWFKEDFILYKSLKKARPARGPKLLSPSPPEARKMPARNITRFYNAFWIKFRLSICLNFFSTLAILAMSCESGPPGKNRSWAPEYAYNDFSINFIVSNIHAYKQLVLDQMINQICSSKNNLNSTQWANLPIQNYKSNVSFYRDI